MGLEMLLYEKELKWVYNKALEYSDDEYRTNMYRSLFIDERVEARKLLKQNDFYERYSVSKNDEGFDYTMRAYFYTRGDLLK